MAYSVFTPFLQLREFLDDGRLNAGGTMAFYKAGSSEEYGDIYADSTGTPQANPVVLNGAGTARIFGPPVAFHLMIRDAQGALVFEIDNVFPFGQGAGGSGLGTLAVVLTYGALRSLTSDYDAVIVCGRDAVGDGGEGLFVRSPISTPDNDGTVLVRASTRYTRVGTGNAPYFTGEIDPRWFGVQYNVPADQSGALDNALAVGVVRLAGQTFIESDHHFTGKLRVVPGGGFYSSAAAKIYMDGTLLEGAAGMFPVGVVPVFAANVCETLHASWFGTVAQSLCTIWSYRYLFDVDRTISGDLTIPANYAVDFESGAKLRVDADASITIKNLRYQGVDQIIAYDLPDFVHGVDLGGADVLLEWFGGQAGTGFGIDNRAPGKAALASGRVKLLAPFYRIPSTPPAWNTGKALRIFGASGDGSETLQLDQAVTVTSFQVVECTLTGTGSLTASGTGLLESASALGGQKRSSAGTHDATDALYLPASYLAAGSGGMLRTSSDAVAWTSISGVTDALSSLARGPVLVATGEAGRIWKSVDGGTTWASRAVAGSSVWNRVKYLQGKYILLGVGVVAVSTDAVAWNTYTLASTGALQDIEFHASTSLYVVVGAAAYLATSADLTTWTKRPLPSEVLGALNCVVAGPGGPLVASGVLGGAWLRSTDAVTWTQFVLPAAETIYCAAASTDTILLGGSNGAVFLSNDQGTTFRRVAVGSGPVFSVSQAQGDWILGLTSGQTRHSTDLSNWALGYIGVATDVRALLTTAPVYAVVGQSGELQTSPDGITWTLATVDGSTANWNKIRNLGGVALLLGDTGRLFSTTDFRSFRQIPTGSSANLFDITLNTTTGVWAVVGAAGRIATTPSLTVPSPVWSTPPGYTPISEDIRRIAWSQATGYVLASSNTILRSPDLTASVAVNSWTIAGMIYDGTAFVQFGTSGTILRSTSITGPWTKITSPSAANLLSGISQGGVMLLGGAGGVLLRSTDHGQTWSSISTSISNNINSIAWNAGTSKLGLCTSAAGIYQSNDLGLTWSSINGSGISGTPDLLCIWARGSEWNVCGASGKWAYTTSTAWTERATGVAVTLYAGEADVVVGAAGTVLSVNAAWAMMNWTSVASIAADLRRFVKGIALDSTGKAWSIDAIGRNVVAAGLQDSTCTALCWDGASTLYALGGNLWTAPAAKAYSDWTKTHAKIAGALDLQLVAGVFVVVGAAGLAANSADGLVWNWIGAKYDTADHYSVGYYQVGELSFDYQGVRAFAQGPRMVLAGVGGVIWSDPSLSGPAIAANLLTCIDATATTDLVSTQPAPIQSSRLRSISRTGAASDSSFSRFHGSLDGNLLRCSLVAIQTVPVTAALIAESSISKSDTGDATRAPLFSFSGSRLQIDATSIETNGALLYSESESTSVILNDCANSQDFGFALTNGYAKIHLNRCGAVRNASAYAIDGQTLDDSVTLYASSTVTAATTSWAGLPAGSTSDGTKITLGAAMPVAGDPGAMETLRFYGSSVALDFLEQLGGRIKVEVEYPAGFTPDSAFRLSAKLVRPRFYQQYPTPGQQALIVSGRALGQVNPCGIAKQAGKAVAWVNVWGGMQNALKPTTQAPPSGSPSYSTTTTVDQWGDTSQTNGTGPQAVNAARRIVIFGEAAGSLPAGTKITVSVVPKLPRTQQALGAFYNPWSNTLDAAQQLEGQALMFISAGEEGVKVLRARNAGSVIANDKDYLSFGEQPVSVPGLGQVYTGPYPKNWFYYILATEWGAGWGTAIFPTDKSFLFPVLAASLLLIEIQLHGLADSELNTLTVKSDFNGTLSTAEFIVVATPPTTTYVWYTKPDRHIIENGEWSLISRTKLLRPEGV